MYSDSFLFEKYRAFCENDRFAVIAGRISLRDEEAASVIAEAVFTPETYSPGSASYEYSGVGQTKTGIGADDEENMPVLSVTVDPKRLEAAISFIRFSNKRR